MVKYHSDTGGSGFLGGKEDLQLKPSTLLVIFSRWHSVAKPGKWIVTFNCGDWGENVDAVVDDFGNLVCQRSTYVRPI